MSTHKHIGRICAAALLLSLALAVLFLNGEALGLQSAAREMGYETLLFDTGRVHTIDIVMDGWEDFLETCENEEYSPCSVVIDGEGFRNVGLRAKGNTSLSTVSALGSDRYSFKLEFDQYDTGATYHGLDKLCLNNLIQDNTMMKDYLVYQMMARFGAASPLCSFVFITVNGEDWGLYLAVEGVEDSFLQRSYGTQHGELYKPDSMSFGGGRGNGREFNMEDFDFPEGEEKPFRPQERREWTDRGGEGEEPPAMPEGGPRMDGGPGGGMGAGDVKLQYIDDGPDSYSNIFGSAKTEASEADQQRLIRALKALSQGDAASAVDVDAVLRYFVVHNFVVNGDSYTGSMVHNYYLYEEDGLLSMLPWDYNLAFGTFQGNDASGAVNDPIDTPLSVTGDGSRPMADWIVSNEEYTALYHQYFLEFLNTVDPAALIDEAYALIGPYVERDLTRFCTGAEFEAGVRALKTFCALRRESVSGQLAGMIPSTGAGQSADASALVDASGLNLSDMGTMSRGGGPGERSEENTGPQGEPMAAPAFGPRDMERPEDFSGPDQRGQQASRASEDMIWLGASVLVLLLSLLAAGRCRRFGRRK